MQGWSWHDCHQHWHYDNYAHYALRDLCTDDTVAWEDRAVVGHKNGWCIARPRVRNRTRTHTHTSTRACARNCDQARRPRSPIARAQAQAQA